MLPDESGVNGWLRYAPAPLEFRSLNQLPSRIIALGDDDYNDSSPVKTAALELQRGMQGIFGKSLEISPPPFRQSDDLIIGTFNAYKLMIPGAPSPPAVQADGFWIQINNGSVHILGSTAKGALYGAFEYLARLARGQFSDTEITSSPSAPIRWANEWDNMDGSIERGYGGRSIFFDSDRIVEDLVRVGQYARLLSSIGINGIIVNNVNTNPVLLSPQNLKGLARIADVMRPYGIRIGVAINFDSPKLLGNLSTSDPLDPSVIAWWDQMTGDIYSHVPDLAGYIIKANSEGQPGPLTYGRTLADGANLFARALKKRGDGLLFYRAFVYDHHLNENDWKNDRANAAVEYFKDLDDDFDDNVIIQIKFGPIDFQVREPPSPLFANLRKTKVAIEFMVAQEYLGQQSHLVYQAPLWKTVLDFDLRIDNKKSVISDILADKRFDWPLSGYAAVVNVGNDDTWLGSHLAMLNLYSYGRLAWDPLCDPEQLAHDWASLTFGVEKRVVDTVTTLCMESWPVYEKYSGNLGIQTLCDIIGIHFGPGPWSMDGNGWGQWTRAGPKSVGMDRTSATGTRNAAQYPKEVSTLFEKIETTPEELLLWFHHVLWTHVLKSGKTVIQHFYDEHYEGAAQVQTFERRWAQLNGMVDKHRFEHVARRLKYQAGHAIVWRDIICRFYNAKCGIADSAGRVGNYPYRIEIQDMHLDGYEIIGVNPPQIGSRGQVGITTSLEAPGIAEKQLSVSSGQYDVAANYFDHLGGISHYELSINENLVGEWSGDLEHDLGHDFSHRIDGHSATRITFKGVRVNVGDVLKIRGRPDGSERAPIDYISILPEGIID